MRLQLHLSPNTQPVPFTYLHNLTGALHKWLGNNDVHNDLSLYSFSWLKGGRKEGDKLRFAHGATWSISFFDDDQSRRILEGVKLDSQVAFGMRVIGIDELPTPDFGEVYRFETDGAPVVTRGIREDGSRDYLLWDNPAADAILTTTLRKKLMKAGYTGEHLNAKVYFDRSYRKAKTKLNTIKGISHKGSECPVIIVGTPEAVRFAWLVGVGDLTGSGFGALY